MTFAQIPASATIFLDANTLVYHFANHPSFGAACTQLVKRIEQHQLSGCISTHVLTDVGHRLMTLEALDRFGWPAAGVAARLRKHHSEIPGLHAHAQAIARVPLLGLQVLAVTSQIVEAATVASQQYELLMGDSLIVAFMQAHGLTNIASNDRDFDRVSGLTRFAPG
jgi:predicted nucleic acid-binding protein